MFSTRKYSPLPTNSGPQRKRAGGAAPWKRWAMIGTAVTVVLFMGYSYSGSSSRELAWEADAERELITSARGRC
jgi:guanosine-diphosphatase